jgi:hypothetical protein
LYSAPTNAPFRVRRTVAERKLTRRRDCRNGACGAAGLHITLDHPTRLLDAIITPPPLSKLPIDATLGS